MKKLKIVRKWVIRITAVVFMFALVMINIEIANTGSKTAVNILGIDVMISTNVAQAFNVGMGQDCDTLTGCTGPSCDGDASDIDISTCYIECSGGSMIVCARGGDPTQE